MMILMILMIIKHLLRISDSIKKVIDMKGCCWKMMMMVMMMMMMMIMMMIDYGCYRR